MIKEYKAAQKRLLLLDYDGTLVKFHKMRNKALPTKQVLNLINELSEDPSNQLVIISGRPMSF